MPDLVLAAVLSIVGVYLFFLFVFLVIAFFVVVIILLMLAFGAKFEEPLDKELEGM